MTEIKKCKKCGGEAHVYPHRAGVLVDGFRTEPRTIYFVDCDNKDCWERITTFYGTEDRAIEAWNENGGGIATKSEVRE